jgi:UDP-N-acetylmuramoyl-L-alanyl-D-glutamate--2,6-diaminopimelate ligase
MPGDKPSSALHRPLLLPAMKLRRILADLDPPSLRRVPETEITSVTADSRQVQAGALFVALRGGTADGHRFLAEAAGRGAAAAVGQEPDPGLGIPYVQVPDSRLALAQAAAGWHGHPARKLVMVGVTGTDGKTTTCNLIYQILLAAGVRAGMITTVNAVIGDRTLDTGFHVTTPDALSVQGYLREMVAAGLTHCVLEATSHGLAQRRVAACDFDLGVVTNVTHEHLDYHGSYTAYLQAKGLLFAELMTAATKPGGPAKAAVLNLDDSSFEYLSQATGVRRIAYGMAAEAGVRGESLRHSPAGLRFTVRGPGYAVEVATPLLGDYNASNCLAAFAAAVEGLDLTPQAAVDGIAALASVPGRMERIDLGQPFTALVDFAHTPNALRRALQTARGLTAGRVIAVFGSAGLRDREKRRLMAEEGVRSADATILTAEDPRTESLDSILEEMAGGARAQGGQEGTTFWRVPDRGEALRTAVRMARAGDLVVACGKGHEQSMCFGEVEHPWDDRVALTAALADLLQVEGPAMPHLPTSP